MGCGNLTIIVTWTAFAILAMFFVYNWSSFWGQISHLSSSSQFEKGGYDSAAVVYKSATHQYRSRVNKQQLQRQKQDQWKQEGGWVNPDRLYTMSTMQKELGRKVVLCVQLSASTTIHQVRCQPEEAVHQSFLFLLLLLQSLEPSSSYTHFGLTQTDLTIRGNSFSFSFSNHQSYEPPSSYTLD